MKLAATLLPMDRAPRHGIGRWATLRDSACVPLDILVGDLSRTGFLAEVGAELSIGSAVRFGLAGLGTRNARIVRREARGYGCVFLDPLREADLLMIETAHADEPKHLPALETVSPTIARTAEIILKHQRPADGRIMIGMVSLGSVWTVLSLGMLARAHDWF